MNTELDPATFITKEELEVFTTVRQFIQNAEIWHTRFAKTAEAKSYLREQRGYCKKLCSEVIPLAAYLEAEFGRADGVSVRYLTGNQPYDAELVYQSLIDVRPPRYVEITSIAMDYDMAARMRELSRTGGVSASGPVIRTRDESGRLIPRFIAIAQYASSALGTELAKLNDAIEKKRAKSYPRGTALILDFDDALFARDPDAREALNGWFEDCAIPRLVNSGFCQVALTSYSRFYGSKYLP